MADTTIPPAPPGFEDVPPAPSGFTDAPKPIPPTLSAPKPDDDTNPLQPTPAPPEAYAAVSNKLFQRTQPGYLMSVVNQAFKLDEPLGMSKDTIQSLKDAGIFNDQAKGQFGYAKDFAETILRPAAVIGDAALRGINAAVVGTVGLLGAGAAKTGLTPDSTETNAYHAQQFNDDLMMVLATSPDALGSRAASVSKEVPVPPSMEKGVIAAPKPWQAEMAPTEEAAAPPIRNIAAASEPPKSLSVEVPPAGATDAITHTNPILSDSGNLNLNYINTDKDTKDILAQTAQAYDDKFGTTISLADTEDQARATFEQAQKEVANGIPDALANYQRGGAVDTDLAWMARQVNTQAGAEVARLSKISSTTGLPEDRAAAEEAIAKLVQITNPARHEVSATSGRVLNSFQITITDPATGMTDEAATKLASMKNVDDIIRVAGTLDTPQAVAKFVADAQKPSFADMGMYYIFNNYLSGPITHLAYTASWAIQTVIRAGIETPIASAVGKLQEWAGKTLAPEEVGALQQERMGLVDKLASADSTLGVSMSAAESQQAEARLAEINTTLKNAITVMPKEAAARFYGIGEGALDSIRAFGRGLKTADIQMLPGEMKKAEDAAEAAKAAAMKAGLEPEKIAEAAKAAYQDAATNFGNPIVEYGKMMDNPKGSATVQALGQVIGAPMRVIAAIHSGQKFSGYAESMNALAYRQAAFEGLEGDALAQRIAVLKNDPPLEMMQKAAEESKYAALMGQSGEVGRKFQSLANSNAWTRVVVPFSKVVTNLTSQKLLERTPVGILSEVVRGNLLGANGNAAQATSVAKMLTGSTLLMGGAYLASQGVNHGWGSDDKNERAFQYLSGNSPYSVTIGDINLPHRFFGVAGGSLSLGADVHDIFQAVNDSDAGWSDWLAAVGTGVHYLGRDILSENALTGPAELYEAINDKENAAKHFVPNAIASAFVPYSSFQSQINSRFIDPIMRQTMGEDSYDSIMQTIESRTPYISKVLMPKVDIFGNPMERYGDHSWAEKDPVMQALSHLEIFPSAVQSKLFGVNLDEKQFADYATLAGRSFYQQLLPQVSNPNWVRLSDQAQAEVIQSAIKVSRAQARGTMSLLYPQIVKDSAQQKMDLLHQYDDDQ